VRDDCRARQGKPGDDDVLVWARREVAQAVEASADAFVTTPWPGVVDQCAPVHAGAERLFRGEIACLRLSDPVEAIVVNFVRHKRDIIPQKSDTLRPELEPSPSMTR
jgi:hypothetical protein